MIEHCYTPIVRECYDDDDDEDDTCEEVFDLTCSTVYTETELPRTECKRLARTLCGSPRCKSVPGPTECYNKTRTIVSDIPQEMCDLLPQKICHNEYHLQPFLQPIQHCQDRTREVCYYGVQAESHQEKSTLRKWCFNTSDDQVVLGGKDVRKGKSNQGIEPGIHVQSGVKGVREHDTDAKRIEEIADHLKIEYEKKYNNIEYPYQTVDSFIEPELNSTVYILDAKRKYNKTSQTQIIDSIPEAQKLKNVYKLRASERGVNTDTNSDDQQPDIFDAKQMSKDVSRKLTLDNFLDNAHDLTTQGLQHLRNQFKQINKSVEITQNTNMKQDIYDTSNLGSKHSERKMAQGEQVNTARSTVIYKKASFDNINKIELPVVDLVLSKLKNKLKFVTSNNISMLKNHTENAEVIENRNKNSEVSRTVLIKDTKAVHQVLE